MVDELCDARFSFLRYLSEVIAALALIIFTDSSYDSCVSSNFRNWFVSFSLFSLFFFLKHIFGMPFADNELNLSIDEIWVHVLDFFIASNKIVEWTILNSRNRIISETKYEILYQNQVKSSKWLVAKISSKEMNETNHLVGYHRICHDLIKTAKLKRTRKRHNIPLLRA